MEGTQIKSLLSRSRLMVRTSCLVLMTRQFGYGLMGYLRSSKSSVNSVAFSPGGKCIVSGSADGTIWLRSTETGNIALAHLKVIRGRSHLSCFHLMASPLYQVLGTTQLGYGVEMCNTASGSSAYHKGGVTSVAFSPCGQYIISGSHDKTIILWDSETGDIISGPFTGHTDSIAPVAYFPDGTRFASGSWDHARLWGAQMDNVIFGPLEGHVDVILSISFSPDGTRIVSGSMESGDG